MLLNLRSSKRTLYEVVPVSIIADKFAGNLFEYVIPDHYVIEPQVTPIEVELQSPNLAK